MKHARLLIFAFALFVLAGCLGEVAVMAGDSPPQITGLQKVEVQTAAGQPLVGVTVQMTLDAADGAEPVNTVGVSNERGRLDLPKAPSATYYFNLPGHAQLTLRGRDVFGKTPLPSPDYVVQGSVLVVTLRRNDAAQLMDTEQMKQRALSEAIRNFSIGPVGTPPAQ